MMEKVAIIAAVTLPLWNIPMIIRMVKRKSAGDMSLTWAIGVWVSFVLMLPDGLSSSDIVWKCFSIANITMFTVVLLVIFHYRLKGEK